MARIVKKEAHSPFVIKAGDKTMSICACGLSKNQPYCDGSHKLTLDEAEGKTYKYGSDGSREELNDL